MKKIFFVVIPFFTFFCSAQEKGSVVVNWNESNRFEYGDSTYAIPQFASNSFVFDEQNKSIFFNLKIATSALVDENSLQITNVVYETIEENKLGDLSKQAIPNALKTTLENYISRDRFFGLLTLSPIIKDGSNYKKIKSFDYTFNEASIAYKTNFNAQNTSSLINSVLSIGTWKRFYVEKSGVYKISKSFLSEIGINTTGVDPKRIKIYGNGGRMLPLQNNVFYPNDLAENAIQVIGENDGSFDNEDYILFYAEGMDNWSDENDTHLNLYSDKAYYYVTTDGDFGKRMNTMVQPTGATTLTLTNFDDYQFHEVDLINLNRLGRMWFGESFQLDNEQEFNFNFPNGTSGSPVNVEFHFGDISFVNTKFIATINGGAPETINLTHIFGSSPVELIEKYHSTTTTSNSAINIKLAYDNTGVPSSKGYLDYIKLSTKSNLSGYGKQYRFQYNNANLQSGIVQYQFNNAATINQVWDITDIYNVTTAINTNQNDFFIKANLGQTKKYIAVDLNDCYAPLKDNTTAVANQNLKGTIFNNNQGNFQDIDYLIVTPSALTNPAERLANFHRSYSNLNVKVVSLESIYQEFSSGKQDIGAIRNFVKYVYQNASAPDKRVKYLNLFGDASFDFKNRIPNNTNVVPIYHALYSLSTGESSFASDDFFALMDANEGNTGGADIAVGRMLVSSVQQADEMVNKVIEYHDIQSYGSWRNNYVAISDDSDKSSDSSLQQKQNSLTDAIHAQKPFINFKKILLDSYTQETSSGGDRYPRAKEEIVNAFEKGALVFNYLGHGGEDGLTGERIWDKLDGYNFNNRYKYPLFITITCEFSRFDNPYRPTAGEYTYWNPKGGAISMITTIRSIGQSTAETFNDVLASRLFAYNSNNYTSIAEALRLAKTDSSNNSSSRVVFYLGDPALMLAIPKQKIVLTKVNDIALNQAIPDLQALSYVKLSGEVVDENNILQSNYNGELFVNVFDKNYNKTTLNNDNFSPPITFTNLGETIFRGNASINNGKFEFGFVVPRDIRIPLGNGRISFYGKRNQTLLDKTGYNLDIKVGGINTNAVADDIAPKVRLYMNDETFINGGITNQSPYFLAFLEDEHGINTASGIGHDIVAILDGNESNPYVLNDYYETELDDYTRGKIRFPFRNLSIGLHTIVFKAWDVYNNYVSAEIQFVVVGDQEVTLTNVLNYPNPFVNYTQFWFTHNKPYETLDVQVQIITITGKLVKTINQTVYTEGFLSREITWDGKDDFGDRIGKGVYIYKLTVRSNLTNEKAQKIEKLVIL